VKPTPVDRKPLLLASASPRRSDLLSEAGVAFAVEPARVQEREDPTGDPVELARFNAELKAAEVAGRFPDRTVLAADTVVALENKVLGKPADREEAFRMLRELAGRAHTVVTGVSVIRFGGEPETFSVSSCVRFRELSDARIRAYLADVHVLDKAGAYALQEEGARIVEGVEGSRANVIGLPVEELRRRGVL
jgi:septum formation protein